MRILFRTDADKQIGTGHLMRCLALADRLHAEGDECTFLCRGAGLGALAQRITDAGHQLIALPEAEVSGAGADLPVLSHALWLPGGWQSDLDACLAGLGDQPVADWLIVDHYALDRRWEAAMRHTAKRVMVIDDLADRQHDCDLLLDQNQVLGMDCRYDGRLPMACTKLLGPRYALLRSEFSHTVRVASDRAPTQVPRLLVMFGGADAQNLTLRTVEVLAKLAWRGAIDVVAGPLYPELPSLREVLNALPNARLHAPATDIAALMRAADLSIGSPGVASWERCVCALPSLTIAQADNQEPIGEALAIAGAHWYLGRAETVLDADIEAALLAWERNSFACQAMSAVAASVCDGQGVFRVIRHLRELSFRFRPVTTDDALLLFSWRNDERTRQYFFNPRPIEFSRHLEWLSVTLNSSSSTLLLAERGGVPVACIRFDCREHRATVSIYIDPDLHGQGIGIAALSHAVRWLFENRPEVEIIEADVLAGNESSHRVFRGAGFESIWSRYELSREKSCLA